MSNGQKYSRGLLRRDRNALAATFPKAFEAPNSGNPKRPLKIGVSHDIAERGGVPGASGHAINQWRMSAAITDYTSGRRYQESLAAGGMRIDLDGNDVEAVKPDAQEHARQRLAAMVVVSPAAKDPAP